MSVCLNPQGTEHEQSQLPRTGSSKPARHSAWCSHDRAIGLEQDCPSTQTCKAQSAGSPVPSASNPTVRPSELARHSVRAFLIAPNRTVRPPKPVRHIAWDSPSHLSTRTRTAQFAGSAIRPEPNRPLEPARHGERAVPTPRTGQSVRPNLYGTVRGQFRPCYRPLTRLFVRTVHLLEPAQHGARADPTTQTGPSIR